MADNPAVADDIAVADDVAVADDDAPTSRPAVTISVTAPGRVGAARLQVHCTECGAQESRYVPRGTVSVEHVCGDGWRPAVRVPAGAAG